MYRADDRRSFATVERSVSTDPRHNKPANQLRWGNIKATIWENTSEKGPFFSTTFSRRLKDQSGAWRNGILFALGDLEALLIVACDVKEWIAAHALKCSAASLGDLRVSWASLCFERVSRRKWRRNTAWITPRLERIVPSSSRDEYGPVLLNMLPDLTR